VYLVNQGARLTLDSSKATKQCSIKKGESAKFLAKHCANTVEGELPSRCELFKFVMLFIKHKYS
jgi:hypothetical protein